jgi:hypothetical protein
MIRKSGTRFSEKIMLKQKARAGCRFNYNSFRSSDARWRRAVFPEGPRIYKGRIE